MLSEQEKIRYARILALEEIGITGMERLRNAAVLVVGCGALGSICAMYLAGSGIGRIGIADFDTIDISNLQRQLFYDLNSVGKSKALSLEARMNAINPDVETIVYNHLITPAKAKEIFPEYDFIIDATDNPTSKFMVDNICTELEIPYCIGGVSKFEGQVMSWSKGHVRYSEIFSTPMCNGGFTPCSIGGVIGPAAGVIASMQATEAIKHITEAGNMLYDKIFMLDLLTFQSSLLQLD